MRESTVEDYLVEQVIKSGGVVRKVKWIGRRGAPDRLCGWTTGKVIFGDDGRPVIDTCEGRHALVEVKQPGAKARPEQAREHERLRTIGFEVVVIDTLEGVDAFVERMA